MIKVADKQSTDPIQQKLRSAKKQWNKDVSSFIDDFIHYKKLINGQPNKFFQERSTIKEPIPADPATILSNLISQFQKLSQHGNTIISAQIEYSKIRKKKQEKTSSMSYDLDALASSSLSRFFTKLLNPTWGASDAARIKKYRMSLLDNCASMYKDLEKFQVEIVKSSNQSIIDANNILNTQVWRKWDLINKGLYTFKLNTPVLPVKSNDPSSIEDDKDNTIQDTKSNKESVKAKIPVKNDKFETNKNDIFNEVRKIQNDYLKNYKFFINNNMVGSDVRLETAISSFIKASDNDKNNAANLVIEEYGKLINVLNASLFTSGNTIGEIAEQFSKEASISNNQIEKVAQDFLKKWWGKKMHEFSLFDKTSGFRLDLYKMADEIRVSLNKMMDSLEKSMNIDELTEISLDINKKIQSLKNMTRAMYASFLQLKSSKKD